MSAPANGRPRVLADLERRYASDADVTVEEVECIADAGGAPSMQVNYEFHEGLTPDRAELIIEEYRTNRRVAWDLRRPPGIVCGIGELWSAT